MTITRSMYALGAWLLAACVATPVSPDHQVAAQAAVERASNAGADRFASRELALARSKLAQAREAAARGDGVAARRLALESEADASLAWALSGAAKSSLAAEALDQAIQALRLESGNRIKAPASRPFTQ